MFHGSTVIAFFSVVLVVLNAVLLEHLAVRKQLHGVCSTLSTFKDLKESGHFIFIPLPPPNSLSTQLTVPVHSLDNVTYRSHKVYLNIMLELYHLLHVHV